MPAIDPATVPFVIPPAAQQGTTRPPVRPRCARVRPSADRVSFAISGRMADIKGGHERAILQSRVQKKKAGALSAPWKGDAHHKKRNKAQPVPALISSFRYASMAASLRGGTRGSLESGSKRQEAFSSLFDATVDSLECRGGSRSRSMPLDCTREREPHRSRSTPGSTIQVARCAVSWLRTASSSAAGAGRSLEESSKAASLASLRRRSCAKATPAGWCRGGARAEHYLRSSDESPEPQV